MVGRWLLAVGRWLLAVSCWLLVAGSSIPMALMALMALMAPIAPANIQKSGEIRRWLVTII